MNFILKHVPTPGSEGGKAECHSWTQAASEFKVEDGGLTLVAGKNVVKCNADASVFHIHVEYEEGEQGGCIIDLTQEVVGSGCCPGNGMPGWTHTGEQLFY